MSATATLWSGRMSDTDRRRTTQEVYAVVIDTAADTIPPPAKVCALCGESTAHAEWIAHPRRRPWPSFGAELSEPCCTNTLSMPVNPLPAVVR